MELSSRVSFQTASLEVASRGIIRETLGVEPFVHKFLESRDCGRLLFVCHSSWLSSWPTAGAQ